MHDNCFFNLWFFALPIIVNTSDVHTKHPGIFQQSKERLFLSFSCYFIFTRIFKYQSKTCTKHFSLYIINIRYFIKKSFFVTFLSQCTKVPPNYLGIKLFNACFPYLSTFFPQNACFVYTCPVNNVDTSVNNSYTSFRHVDNIVSFLLIL